MKIYVVIAREYDGETETVRAYTDEASAQSFCKEKPLSYEAVELIDPTRPTKICKWCEKEFQPHYFDNGTAKVCSPECRKQDALRRERLRYASRSGVRKKQQKRQKKRREMEFLWPEPGAPPKKFYKRGVGKL